jgi:hypothetical protein
MDLFVTWIIGHFYTGNADEFFKSDLSVEIRVEKIEYLTALGIR